MERKANGIMVGETCADCVLCKADRDGVILSAADLARYEAEGRIKRYELAPGVVAYAPVPSN